MSVVKHHTQAGTGVSSATIDEDSCGNILESRPGRIEHEHLIATGSPRYATGDDGRKLTVDVLFGHHVGLDGVVQIASGRAGSQGIDHDPASRQRGGIDFLLGGIVGAHGRHEQSGMKMLGEQQRRFRRSCRSRRCHSPRQRPPGPSTLSTRHPSSTDRRSANAAALAESTSTANPGAEWPHRRHRTQLCLALLATANDGDGP